MPDRPSLSQRGITDYFTPLASSGGISLLDPPGGPSWDLGGSGPDGSQRSSPAVSPALSRLNHQKFHRFKAIPTPRVVTMNVNGLSVGEGSRKKFFRVRACIRALARKADVILLQETNAPHTDLKVLALVPGFTPYANPGRTAILVRDSLVVGCAVSDFVVVPGHIHGVRILPLSDDALFSKSWSVINVYLQAGSKRLKRSLRLSQIQALRSFRRTTDYLIVGGDWNMVTSQADTASGSHYASSPDDVRALESALCHLRVREAHQANFTRFANKDPPEASRLDRIYFSHAVSDQTLMRATAQVVSLPKSFRKKPISDHLPVRLSFSPNGLRPNTRFKIPAWIPQDPSFALKVKSRWALVKKPKNPIRVLTLFKKVLKQEARKVLSEGRSAPSTADLSIAVAMFRRAIAGEDPDELSLTFGAKSNRVQALFAEDRSKGDDSYPSLRAFIDGELSLGPLGDLPATSSDQAPLQLPFNFLKKAKHTLPSSRKHLSSLFTEDGTLLDEPAEIAGELKRVWEPVWAEKEISPGFTSVTLPVMSQTTQAGSGVISYPSLKTSFDV